MAYELHIYFTGLCVFVPMYDERKQLKEVQVLMPRADPEDLPDGIGPHHFEDSGPWTRHQAALLYQPQEATPSTAVEHHASRGPDQRPLWFLAGDVDLEADPSQITLPDAGSAKLRVQSCGSSGNVPNTNAPAQCSRWIAPIKDAETRLGTIHPCLLADKVHRDLRHLLQARLRLPVGDIRPASFTVNAIGGGFGRWDFGPNPEEPGSQLLQTMATVVEMSCVSDRPISLRARPFSGQGAQRTLIVGDPEPADGRIEMWILNREIEQVLAPDRLEEIVPGHPRNRELGFHFFNRLLDQPLPEAFVPVLRDLDGTVSEDDILRGNDPFLNSIYFPAAGAGIQGAPCCPGIGGAPNG